MDTIDKKELEIAIAQAFYDFSTIAEEKGALMMFDCSYNFLKRLVMFEKYGLYWNHKQDTNSEKTAENPEGFEPIELAIPTLSTEVPKWNKLVFTAEYYTSDFGRRSYTSDSETLLRSEVTEGSILGKSLTGPMWTWASAKVEEVNDEYVAGTSSYGNFKVSPLNSYKSQEKGINDMAVAGSISIDLLSDCPTQDYVREDDTRLLHFLVLKRIEPRDDTRFTIVESLEIPARDISSGNNFLMGKYNSDLLYFGRCTDISNEGIAGTIEVSGENERNFCIKPGQYYRYYMNDKIVFISLTDKEHPNLTELADSMLFRCTPKSGLKSSNNELTRKEVNKCEEDKDYYYTIDDILDFT